MSKSDQPQQRLAVAIIVRDEEKTLAATLASVQKIADQIVVVDTGSTDRSARIAREFGAMIIDADWEDSFSAARNQAMEAIRAEWVLWIDAGEELAREDAQTLRELVDGQSDASTCFALWVELPQATLDSYAERLIQIRLIPSSSALRFEGRVRESLLPAVEAGEFQVERTEIRLLRSSRDLNPERKYNLACRDLPLIEQEIVEQGRLPKWLVAAGDVYVSLGDPAKANAYYREAVAQAEKGSTEQLAAYYGLLTCNGLTATPEENPTEVCIEALQHFPFDAQLLCAMGNYMQVIGQTEMATRSFELAVNYGEVNPLLWHVADVTEMAALCLSALLRNQKEYDRAEAALNEVIAARPQSIRLQRAMLDLYIRQGRQHEALGAVDALSGDVPHRDALRSAVRGACLVQQKNWIPAVAHLQTAYSAGCRDAVCLQWLSVALISTDCLEAAEPVVNAWLAIEPHNAEVRRYAELLSQRASDGSFIAGASLGTSDAVTTVAMTHTSDQGDAGSFIVTTAEAPVAKEQTTEDSSPQKRITTLRIDAAAQPHDSDIHLQLGSALVKQGQGEEAEQVYRAYLNHSPEDTNITTALSELLVSTRRVQEGLELATPLVSNQKIAPHYREFALGLEHFGHQRWEKALEHFQASHDAGYDHPRLREYQARSFGNLERYVEAEPLWRELLLIEPSNATAHDELAKLLDTTGREAEADSVRGQLMRLRSVPSQIDIASGGFPGPSVTST